MRRGFLDAVDHALPGADVVRVEGVVVAVAERATRHPVDADGMRIVLRALDEVDRLRADRGLRRRQRAFGEQPVGLDVHVDGRDLELPGGEQGEERVGVRHLVRVHDLGAGHAWNLTHQIELLLECTGLLVLAEPIAQQSQERGDDGVLHACAPTVKGESRGRPKNTIPVVCDTYGWTLRLALHGGVVEAGVDRTRIPAACPFVLDRRNGSAVHHRPTSGDPTEN